jgi:hypothetical protein
MMTIENDHQLRSNFLMKASILTALAQWTASKRAPVFKKRGTQTDAGSSKTEIRRESAGVMS